MDHVAGVLKRPTEELRAINMFHEGEETHFTQILEKCQVICPQHGHQTCGLNGSVTMTKMARLGNILDTESLRQKV